ncbi:RHS repeat-associated core domain-containing protein [bacterium]|nr:RHS repeat-associated core domain-containing protein [bacterium]
MKSVKFFFLIACILFSMRTFSETNSRLSSELNKDEASNTIMRTMSAGDEEDSGIFDIASYFNTVSFDKSTYSTVDFSCSVDDFSGNVILSRTLKTFPLKDGSTADVKLKLVKNINNNWPLESDSFEAPPKMTYRGSIDYQCSYEHAWILSIDGVAVKIFKLEKNGVYEANFANPHSHHEYYTRRCEYIKEDVDIHEVSGYVNDVGSWAICKRIVRDYYNQTIDSPDNDLKYLSLTSNQESPYNILSKSSPHDPDNETKPEFYFSNGKMMKYSEDEPGDESFTVYSKEAGAGDSYLPLYSVNVSGSTLEVSGKTYRLISYDSIADIISFFVGESFESSLMDYSAYESNYLSGANTGSVSFSILNSYTKSFLSNPEFIYKYGEQICGFRLDPNDWDYISTSGEKLRFEFEEYNSNWNPMQYSGWITRVNDFKFRSLKSIKRIGENNVSADNFPPTISYIYQQQDSNEPDWRLHMVEKIVNDIVDGAIVDQRIYQSRYLIHSNIDHWIYLNYLDVQENGGEYIYLVPSDWKWNNLVLKIRDRLPNGYKTDYEYEKLNIISPFLNESGVYSNRDEIYRPVKITKTMDDVPVEFSYEYNTLGYLSKEYLPLGKIREYNYYQDIRVVEDLPYSFFTNIIARSEKKLYQSASLVSHFKKEFDPSGVPVREHLFNTEDNSWTLLSEVVAVDWYGKPLMIDQYINGSERRRVFLNYGYTEANSSAAYDYHYWPRVDFSWDTLSGYSFGNSLLTGVKVDSNKYVDGEIDGAYTLMAFADYNDELFLETYIDPMGRNTAYEYDIYGRLTKVGKQDLPQSLYGYDDTLRTITASTEYLDGAVVANAKYHFDSFFRIEKEWQFFDKNGNTALDPSEFFETRYEYNDFDNLIRKISPSGISTEFKYDQIDRVIETRLSKDGDIRISKSEHLYFNNENGVFRSEKIWSPKADKSGDPNMEYLYDVEDGLIMVKEYNDAAIYETSYDYDALGNLTLVTDSRGNQSQFQYNYLSQLVNKIESDGSWEEYENNLAGNVLGYQNSAQVAKNYSYDTLGRLGKIESSISQITQNIKTINYDLMGNVLKETDDLNGNTYTYEYDGLDRITKKTIDLNGNMMSFTYGYDNNRNRLNNLWYDFENDGILDQKSGFAYEEFSGKLKSGFSESLGGLRIPLFSVENHFDTFGRLSSCTVTKYPTGISETTEYAYSPLNEILKIDIMNLGNNNIIYTNSYEYDKNGNRIKLIDEDNIETEYGYDRLGRLNNVTGPMYSWFNDDKTPFNTEYNYDSTGNRLSYQSPFHTHSYNIAHTSNRLLSWVDNVKKRHNYTYDDFSNIIRKETLGNDTLQNSVDFVYNEDNRIVKATMRKETGVEKAATLELNYQYDFRGLRVYKLKQLINGEKTEGFYFRGMNGKVLAELEAGDREVNYYFGNKKIMKKDKNGTHYYHYDVLGSPVVVTDTMGSIENTYKYGPFGNIIKAKEKYKNKDGYTGHEYDEETNLHYANARYLDQRIGRWMSKDRASLNLKNPQSLNRWIYVLNNPLRYIDLDGLREYLVYSLYRDYADIYLSDNTVELALTGESSIGEIFDSNSKMLGQTDFTAQVNTEGEIVFDFYIFTLQKEMKSTASHELTHVIQFIKYLEEYENQIFRIIQDIQARDDLSDEEKRAEITKEMRNIFGRYYLDNMEGLEAEARANESENTHHYKKYVKEIEGLVNIQLDDPQNPVIIDSDEFYEERDE